MIQTSSRPSTSAIRNAASVALMVAIPTLTLTACEAEPQPPNQEKTVSQEIQIVDDLMAAFNTKDVDQIMSFFTEDAIYHNMPTGPVQGTEAVRGLIESYVNAAAKVDWEVLTSAQVGSTVLNERLDRFVFGDKDVALPVMGAFEIQGGKIAAWRDYFDQATWTKQMQD